MLGLLSIATALAAPPTDAQLVDALEGFNAHAVFPLPTLDAQQRAELLSGEVLKLLLPQGDDTLRVVGLMYSEEPRDRIWLACQDPHFASPGAATELRMTVDGDRGVWYGILDLPRPFSDRHWVVDVWNNHALAAATDGDSWEHPWQLREDGAHLALPWIEQGAVEGIDAEDFAQAIYTPVNHGAWLFIALPGGGSLAGYHATSVVGGNIPDRLVAEFVRRGLDDLLRRLERISSETVATHYTAAHEDLPGGDGQTLPRYP